MKTCQIVKRKEGQSLVEFALILPILLLIIVAVIDFGWIFYAKLTVNNSTREVARLYVVDEELPLSDEAALAQARMPDLFKGTAYAQISIGGTPAEIRVTLGGNVKPLVGLFFDGDVPVESTTYMKVEYQYP